MIWIAGLPIVVRYCREYPHYSQAVPWEGFGPEEPISLVIDDEPVFSHSHECPYLRSSIFLVSMKLCVGFLASSR